MPDDPSLSEQFSYATAPVASTTHVSAQYALRLDSGAAHNPIDDPAQAIPAGAIIRLLRGPHEGRVAQLRDIRAGWIHYATYPMRYRATHSIQYGSGIRRAESWDLPHANPQVGDSVNASTDDFTGQARVCSVGDGFVIVRAGDRIMRIATQQPPAAEVLIEAAICGPDGARIPINEKFRSAFSEALLEAVERLDAITPL